MFVSFLINKRRPAEKPNAFVLKSMVQVYSMEGTLCQSLIFAFFAAKPGVNSMFLLPVIGSFWHDKHIHLAVLRPHGRSKSGV